MELSDDDHLSACFKELDDKKRGREEMLAEVTSGRLFLKIACSRDPLFELMAAECPQIWETSNVETTLRCWKILSLYLADHGFSLADDAIHNIVSGATAIAHALADDMRNFTDSSTPTILRRTGFTVPVRQRLNPFQPQEGEGQQQRATGLFVLDSQRFMKKRNYLVEQTDRLREKEVKAQRIKEKREREAQQKAQEALKKKEALAQQEAQEQYIRETMQLQKGDPDMEAEKMRKGELLSQLEMLETAYTADQKKINKLKEVQGKGTLTSPRSTTVERAQSPKATTKIRAESRLPFSKHYKTKSSSGWK